MILLRKKYFLFLILLWFVNTEAVVFQQEYLFKQIRIEDGLSQSSVYSILQDQKGYLWFGTANGLNRYNGYDFKIFVNDPLDTTSISDNGILSMLEDREGFIWLGTSAGVLNRYDRRSGTFKRFYITDTLEVTPLPNERYYDFPLPFSRNSDKTITAIAEGKDNSLWIATWGKGLIKFDKKSGVIKRYHYKADEPNGFNSNRVKSILIDGDNVWVGTIGAGLYKLVIKENDIEFINYQSKKNNGFLSDDRVISLFKDKAENIWVGTYGGGLNKLEKNQQSVPPDKAAFIAYKNQPGNFNSLAYDVVTAVTQDQFGVIWVGTYGGGLDKLDPNSGLFSHFKHDPERFSSLSKNEVLSVYEDRSGNIWIGTNLGNGLSKLERNRIKFNHVSRKTKDNKGISDDVVWSIAGDKEDNIWIGTYKGGLNKWDRLKNEFYVFTQNSTFNSINDNHIRALKDDGENLIIGTYAGGLNIFNKQKNIFYKYLHNEKNPASIGANQVQSILIDKDGEYWIGTFGGGLNKIKSSSSFPHNIEFIKYQHREKNPFSISDDRVYTLCEDREGIIWVGTFGGGLNKFDKKTEKFVSYKNIIGDNTSIGDNRVMNIYEDKDGFLWVGTYGGGLQKFNKQTGKFIRFDKKNKLNSSVVYAILEDNSGNLWMSTDNGIYKFNIKSELFTQYDLQDGLQSMEFSGGAYYKTEKGEMFFGGINGYNHFYPDSIKDNLFVPPVVISTVRILNIPVQQERDTIHLAYDRNFLSFEFASLDYTNPIDNQYAFMLEGFDEDWHYVDARGRRQIILIFRRVNIFLKCAVPTTTEFGITRARKFI